MAFDSLIAMNVTSPEHYARYRELMTPLLHEVGGDFRYDFPINEVLRSEATHPITRVFVISFPNRTTRDRFFADPRYLAARKEFFEPAVDGFTVIASYERD